MPLSAPDACEPLLRQHDRDRYALLHFAPPAYRSRVAAVFALNLEISRIAETVSDPMIGHIRYAWWRESLEALYDNKPVREHEVLRAFKPLAGHGGIQQESVGRMIDARERAFADGGCKTLRAFADYCADTAGTVMTMALQAMEHKMPADIAAGRHLGAAHAMLGHLRAVTHFAQNGMCYIPQERLAVHGINKDSLLQNTQTDLRLVAREVALSAEEEMARAGPPGPPLLRAQQAMTQHHMARLRACGFDVFHPSLECRRWKLLLKLLGCAWRL